MIISTKSHHCTYINIKRGKNEDKFYLQRTVRPEAIWISLTSFQANAL